MSEPTAIAISRIPVPASLDAADAGPFLAMSSIANEVFRHDSGLSYFDQDPAELLPQWLDQSDNRQIGFAAALDDRIVGAVTLEVPLEHSATNVEFDVLVQPGAWGRGVEQALLAALEEEARSLGRPTVQTWTQHRPDAVGRRLEPRTGWGSIPADDRQTRFMLENGFTLEQIERNSTFDLTAPLDGVERMLVEAQRVAGPSYRLVQWTNPTPEAYRARFAHTISRMSTDVPTGELVWAEESWDAERVQRRDQRLLDGGHTISVVCVEHIETGVLAAYNELVIGADHSASTHQWGTLVLKEHRGRRLGTIVKCANILRWRDLNPDSPLISTFNAEENRPMLDINEAIGFVVASTAGAWKKTI